MNAIEAVDVSKLYRRYARKRQFATLKSALLSRSLISSLRADETFPALTNVTVAGNTASTGGGLRQAVGSMILRNTIVAGNRLSADCNGAWASEGGNLDGGGAQAALPSGEGAVLPEGSIPVAAVDRRGRPTRWRASGRWRVTGGRTVRPAGPDDC